MPGGEPIPLNRGQVLKAVGIFFVSLAIAVLVGLSLGAFVPENTCAFPVVLDRATTETGGQATVTRVDGDHPVVVLRYKVVLLEAEKRKVILEGNLTDLSPVSPGLSFHRTEAGAEFLNVGDHFRMDLEGEVHLILLDGGGTPIGWTLGCEV